LGLGDSKRPKGTILGAVALAKQTPVERPRLALVNADINIGSVGAMRENIGSAGAMRERDYFQAPQSPFNAGAFPCRLESCSTRCT
jgi:hypothetical protein